MLHMLRKKVLLFIIEERAKCKILKIHNVNPREALAVMSVLFFLKRGGICDRAEKNILPIVQKKSSTLG